ncbi:MAG: hypothetical protein JO316_04360 [Abitibacteriaceae bacterium]|nr:hypothetical protein [Abditibacteriaceae bacterium]
MIGWRQDSPLHEVNTQVRLKEIGATVYESAVIALEKLFNLAAICGLFLGSIIAVFTALLTIFLVAGLWKILHE